MLRKCFLYWKKTFIRPLYPMNHHILPAKNLDMVLMCTPNILNYSRVTYFTNGFTKYISTRSYARSRNNAAISREGNIKIEDSSVVEKLQEIFGCGIRRAQKFYNSNEHLFDDNESLIEKCKYCVSLGIAEKFIYKNPWILEMTGAEIEKKIEMLKMWKFKNISSNFCLMKLATNKLSQLTHKALTESSLYPTLNDSNRITFLAGRLKKNEEDISELAIKYNYLLRMNFPKLENTLDTLLNSGLDPKYIFMDIWVVRYSVEDIKMRLKMLESLEPQELRAWMFHCGNECFQRTIKLKNENRSAREPFADDEAYLCHRLSITPETVEELYHRHPPLRCVQTTKLKDILDYLFAEGFEAVDICRFPRILCHSLLTIKERMDHMKTLGYRPQSLAVCCQTKKKYKIFIKKLQAKQSSNSR
ncbi:hypothetical protein LSTR_LSTR004816 [Laodelphax striatellus]|uniref:Uncharacterized protein n=1 Tax=Laodelphax striatellus TaxID=195883 RepID=A0A482WIH4_LAOST|nr:hypothetical protein LSTR_LSTR004816 [Laodelphax striatellus]